MLTRALRMGLMLWLAVASPLGGQNGGNLTTMSPSFAASGITGVLVPGWIPVANAGEAFLAATAEGRGVPSTVPEPSTLGLAALGAAGMALRLRRCETRTGIA